LVFGQLPPGLNDLLSLDLKLQRQAGELLGVCKGAIVLINASTGDIQVFASHPSFDSIQMDAEGTILLKDENSSLLDRAA